MMFNLDTILFLPALTSIIFIIAGFIMYVFPPKKINYLYGYRTKASMKSQERWTFAQKYASVQMMIFSVYFMVFSFLFSFFNFSEKSNLIVGLVVIIFGVGYLFYKIEKAIKINFPNQ